MTTDKDLGWLDRPGVWSSFADPYVAAALGTLGFGWRCFDQQHGRWDDASTGLALATPAGSPAIVRIRANDVGLVGRALDWGARGVIVPMVDSSADAAAVVRAALYPPLGGRSWGPIAGYAAERAGAPIVGVMLETSTAIDSAEAIAAVPGVDLLFVGPFDLALALGTSVDDLLDDGQVLRRVAAAASGAGIRAGAFAGTPERALRLADLGFTTLAATTDAALLGLGAHAVLDELEHH